ncbi:four helix bundle protein [Candidatus Peregrinibacteria bacterium]|nr:MAG: four helix bundle protein [Candidatus Peregrinibacteria bacterium]
MKRSIIQEKSYFFALKIISFYKYLAHQQREYIIAKQILRSGTSIGANVEEAAGGQSRKDFIAKLCISYKETRETHYWLRLIRDSELAPLDKVTVLIKDCEELLRILGAIKKTTLNSQLLTLN